MLQLKTFFRHPGSTSRFWLAATNVFLLGFSGLATTVNAQQDDSANGLNSHKANAAMNFTIVIPQFLRILENSHPPILQSPPDSPASHISALQRIVVLSTMGKGFCMDMSLTQAHITDWNWNLSMSMSSNSGSWLQQTAGGYRLCLGRAGRYEMILQHEFGLKAASPTRLDTRPGLDWPVHVSVATP